MTERTEVNTKAAMEIVEMAVQPTDMSNYVADIKSKLFRKHNWDTMLIAAPVCLELLGSSEMVASSEWAKGVELELPPQKKFLFLRATWLKGALAGVNNDGRIAFKTAKERMADIAAGAEAVKRSIPEIIMALKQPKPVLSVVNIELTTILDTANSCSDSAKDMYTSFNNWLLGIMELHEACVSTQSRSETQFRQFKSKEEAFAAMETELKKSLETLTTAQKKMEKKMDDHHSLYIQMMKDAPKGSDLLKQQMALMATEVGCNVVSTLAVAGACRISPQASIALGARELGRYKDQIDGERCQDASKKGQEKVDKLEEDIQDLLDPALEICPAVQTTLGHLKKIVSDTEAEGVNWALVVGVKVAGKSDGGKENSGEAEPKEKSKEETKLNDEKESKNEIERLEAGKKANKEDHGKGGASKEKNDEKHEAAPTKEPVEDVGKKSLNLDAVAFLLSKHKQALEDDDGDGDKKASDALSKAIDKVEKVVKDLQEEAKKAQSLKEWTKPQKNSPAVSNWIKDTKDSIASVAKILAKAKRRAGTHTGQSPLIFQFNPDAEGGNKARMDLTRATIENSKNQLEIQKQALLGTQANYVDLTTRTSEIQEKLADIRREIQSYGTATTELSSVRELLRDCISFLLDMRHQLEELIVFFSTLATLVKSAVTTQVKPFTKHVESAAAEVKESGYYEEYLLNIIYKYAINIAANFDLYGDIAIMYKKIHDRHIKEGLYLVDSLSQIRGEGSYDRPSEEQKKQMQDDLAAKKAELKEYATKAKTGIIAIVDETRKDIESQLTTRISAIDEAMSAVPDVKVSLDVQKAIEDGNKEVDTVMKLQTETKSAGIDLLALPADARRTWVKVDPSLYAY